MIENPTPRCCEETIVALGGSVRQVKLLCGGEEHAKKYQHVHCKSSPVTTCSRSSTLPPSRLFLFFVNVVVATFASTCIKLSPVEHCKRSIDSLEPQTSVTLSEALSFCRATYVCRAHRLHVFLQTKYPFRYVVFGNHPHMLGQHQTRTQF